MGIRTGKGKLYYSDDLDSLYDDDDEIFGAISSVNTNLTYNIFFYFATNKPKNTKVTSQLKAKMMYEGTLMIGYQPLGETPNFFRSIISNSAVRKEDIDFMLSELERLGADLWEEEEEEEETFSYNYTRILFKGINIYINMYTHQPLA